MAYGPPGLVGVTFRLLEVLDLEPGHWCPKCALPSACKITLASIAVIGAVEGPLRLSTGLRCSDGWLPTGG